MNHPTISEIATLKKKTPKEKLVGGIPTPLKNMSSSVGITKFPIHVPNHQPVN